MSGFIEPTESLVKTEAKEEDGGDHLQQEHLNAVQQVKKTSRKKHDLNTKTATSTPTSAMTEGSRELGDEDDDKLTSPSGKLLNAMC